jgi:hypothetical protein
MPMRFNAIERKPPLPSVSLPPRPTPSSPKRCASRASRLSPSPCLPSPMPHVRLADVCTLVLRWNDGTRTDRRFAADAPLATVLAFVESRNRHQPTETVALVASYPRRVLTDVDLSLRQLGLVPNSVL